MRANLSDVEGRSFDPLPAGTYLAKVTDGEVREAGPNAKNPGAEYINWEFTVQGGEYEGRHVWTNTMLSGAGAFRLKELLDACGLSSDGEIDFEINDLIGKDVKLKVRVKPETDDYDASNDIRRISPVDTADTADQSLLP